MAEGFLKDMAPLGPGPEPLLSLPACALFCSISPPLPLSAPLLSCTHAYACARMHTHAHVRTSTHMCTHTSHPKEPPHPQHLCPADSPRSRLQTHVLLRPLDGSVDPRVCSPTGPWGWAPSSTSTHASRAGGLKERSSVLSAAPHESRLSPQPGTSPLPCRSDSAMGTGPLLRSRGLS